MNDSIGLHLLIDASMTNSTALLLEESGEYVAHASSSSGIHYREMDQAEFCMAIQNLVRKLFLTIADEYDEMQVKIIERIKKYAITIAGIDERFDRDQSFAYFQGLSIIDGAFTEKLIIRGIGEASHRAIFEGEPGLLIRCGAGCTVFGSDHTQKKHFTNAWGYVGGNDGSGYSIGEKAVNLIARHADGRAKEDEGKFASELLHRISKQRSAAVFFDSIQLRRFLNAQEATTIITSISNHIFAMAKDGDEIANKILDEVSLEITEGIVAVIESLNFSTKNQIPMAFHGGVINMHPSFSKHIISRLVGNKYKIIPYNKENPFKRIVGTGLISLGYINHETNDFDCNGKCKKFLESCSCVPDLKETLAKVEG